jgi:hypothetical protein
MMKIPLLVLAMCIIATFSMVNAISAPTLAVSPPAVTLMPGSSVTYDFRISELPAGLSGYEMKVKLTNPAIGEITRVSFPPWAKIGKASPLPADNVTVSAVDMAKEVEDSSSGVAMVSITVTAIKEGTSNVRIQSIVIEDDHGGSYSPDLPTATMKVLPGGQTTGESSSGGGSLSQAAVSTTVPVTNPSTLPEVTKPSPTPSLTPFIPPVPGTQALAEVPGLPVSRQPIPLLQRIPRWVMYGFGLIALIAALALLYLGIKKRI